MTLPVTDRIAGPYSCNGTVDDFDFAFKVFTTADIRVVKTSAAGVETVLVLDSDYTVALNADQENDPGGTVTTSTAFITGFTVTIDGALTYGQTAEITNLGGFFPKVIERALDRLAILIQQLKRLVDRSIKLSVSDTIDSTELPSAAQRAGRVLGFDADGELTTHSVATTVYGQVVERFTATAAQTAFNLASAYVPGVNAVAVYQNGLRLRGAGIDYTETSANVVTLTTGAIVGDEIDVVIGQEAASPDTTLASAIAYTPGGTGAVASNVQTKLREFVSSADFNNTRGTENFGYGTDVFAANTTGSGNAALGWKALNANTTGSYNVAFGMNALRFNTTGFANTALGENALGANTTGEVNTAVGEAALGQNTTGLANTAVGTEALHTNTTGSSNTAVGQAALRRATIASGNTAVGEQAMNQTTEGISNTALGYAALGANTTHGANVAIGARALEIATAEYNTAVGIDALSGTTTGDDNVAVGSNAGDTITTGNNNVVIGYNAQPSTPTVDNEITIGNVSHVVTRLRGSVLKSTAPAFAAIPSGTLANVTGDGTSYDVVFATELFDQVANVVNGVFTAPVSGKYRFSTTVVLYDIAVGHTSFVLALVTTARTVPFVYINPGAVRDAATFVGLTGSVLLAMAQGETAKVRVNVDGGTKTVNVTTSSIFSGELVA